MNYSWSTPLMTLLAATVCATDLWAVDPPRPTVREALKTGRNAFLARPVSMEEIETSDVRTVVRMDVVVTECLYGPACRGGLKRAQITYMLQTFAPRILTVDFDMGTEVLFVLNRDPSPRAVYEFDSDLDDAVDLAFLGNKLPKAPLDEDSALFTSVYTGKGERVAYSDLRRWARERDPDSQASPGNSIRK